MGKKSVAKKSMQGDDSSKSYGNRYEDIFAPGMKSNYKPVCKLYESYVTLGEIIERFGFKNEDSFEEFCKARDLTYKKEKFHDNYLVRKNIYTKLEKETAKVSVEDKKTYFRVKLPDGYMYSSTLYNDNKNVLEHYQVEVNRAAKVLELEEYLDTVLEKGYVYTPVWTFKFLINTVKFLYLGSDMAERGGEIKRHILQFLRRNFIPLLEIFRKQKDLVAANRMLTLENEKLKIINDHLSLKVDEMALTKIQLANTQSENHAILEQMRLWVMPYIDIVLDSHHGIFSHMEIICLRKKIQGDSSEALAKEYNCEVSNINEYFVQGLRKFNNVMDKLNKSRKVKDQIRSIIESYYINRKEVSQ